MTNKEAIERLEELKELDALGAYYIPAISGRFALMMCPCRRSARIKE